MSQDRMDTTSLWMATSQAPSYAPVDGDHAVDVVVVGGGITGVTAAYLLKQAGRRVALVERRRCGWGETGRTAAHITAVTDAPLSTLVTRLGPDHAQAVWDAGFAALARIRANVRDERINCQFAWVPGYLYAGRDTDLAYARAEMRREAVVAGALGIDATYLDSVPGIGRPGVMFENQARMHPLRYIEVLLSRIHGDGSLVFEGSEVTAIDDVPTGVRVGRYRLRADYVVLATHVPVVRDIWLPAELTTRTSYAVRGVAAPGTLGPGLYWESTADGAYDYLRVDRLETQDEVILGGRDGEPGRVLQEDCFRDLEATLSARVPGVTITHRWTGEVVNSRDGLPYIGEVAPRRFAATGFSGNGMTFGTLAGMMAADAAMGRRSPWRHLFDIRRTAPPTGSWDYRYENRDHPYYAGKRATMASPVPVGHVPR